MGDLCGFQSPRQVQIVGAAFADGDAMSCGVDFFVALLGRGVAHLVAALDQDISRCEQNALATHGVNSEKSNIGLIGGDDVD